MVLGMWSPGNSVSNSQMEKGGENVRRDPVEVKLDHMSCIELSHTSNTMIHKDILAFFKLWIYVRE